MPKLAALELVSAPPRGLSIDPQSYPQKMGITTKRLGAVIWRYYAALPRLWQRKELPHSQQRFKERLKQRFGNPMLFVVSAR